MELLKKGSKGDTVKVLQEALNKRGHNLTVDGIFGEMTEKAVWAFQASRYLQVDGIVGPKTWEALGIVVDDIDIVKGYINTHITHSIGRPVKYIAIHYTAGASSKNGSARAVRNVFLKREASADFVVDDDNIVQINPDLRNYYCWSVGDKKNVYTGGGGLYGKATNKNTISIEICSNLKPGTSSSAVNHEGWYYTEASLDNALRLVRWLMGKFDIPKERVVRHYDISGKACPGMIGWNDGPLYDAKGNKTDKRNNSGEWERFWNRI